MVGLMVEVKCSRGWHLSSVFLITAISLILMLHCSRCWSKTQRPQAFLRGVKEGCTIACMAAVTGTRIRASVMPI